VALCAIAERANISRIMSGTLYAVATPIGNLEDISLRALRVLREVDLIACEDTRRTRILLGRHDIATPTTSYFEHNKRSKGPYLLGLLAAGKSVALVTDAGTPGISDRGFLLVREARAAGHPVVPVPGPSAVIAALSAAGVPADRFSFDGFLPAKPGRRLNRLRALRLLETTVVLYESPHRIAATLEAVREVFGEGPVVVARELTKQFEEIVWATPSEHLARLAAGRVRGEFTLAIPAPARGSVSERTETPPEGVEGRDLGGDPG
jgi:16S rRNA (cytidine1402-2'-O)-methyltransferase